MTGEYVNDQPDRDALAAVFVGRPCPLCRWPLAVDRPRYGWGAMGAGVKCTRCGLRLRAAWQPLRRAVARITADIRAAKVAR